MRKSAIIAIVVGVILVVISPIVFTSSHEGWRNFLETRQIGDTIIRTTAPIIGLLSAVLVYPTLEAQIRFNKRQIENDEEKQFRSEIFHMFDILRELKEKTTL